MESSLIVSSSLKKLSSTNCSIRDEGMKSLGNALAVNDSLEELSLRCGHDISERGVSVLTECLKTNRRLVRLKLSQ